MRTADRIAAALFFIGGSAALWFGSGALPPLPAPEPPKPPITVAQLKLMAPNGKPEIIKALSDNSQLLIDKCKLTNQKRVQQWIAQASVETAGLRTLTEYGPRKYFRRYDGVKMGRKGVYRTRWYRKLGNTQLGDGPRFRGRGFLQTTGRWNYRSASKRIGIDLIANPHLAADPVIAIKTACSFWTHRKLRIKRTNKVYSINYFADRSNTRMVTKLVNGGRNHLKQRRASLRRARGIFAIGKKATVAGWKYEPKDYDIVNEDDTGNLQPIDIDLAQKLHDERLTEQRLWINRKVK
jgi:putative chitinase